MWARACSTLPVNIWGMAPALWAWASVPARSAASSPPSFFRAEISTTSQPRALPSRSRSILSPFFRTRSIMFTATTTGRPNSMSWVVR